IDRHRHDESAVVIGMLADEIDATGRSIDAFLVAIKDVAKTGFYFFYLGDHFSSGTTWFHCRIPTRTDIPSPRSFFLQRFPRLVGMSPFRVGRTQTKRPQKQEKQAPPR